ncbi:MAG: hypothetical protein IJM65_09640 [Bacteroidales bacterium]|nr:hypothetical protein [Bacteroidales bacterium]
MDKLKYCFVAVSIMILAGSCSKSDNVQDKNPVKITKSLLSREFAVVMQQGNSYVLNMDADQFLSDLEEILNDMQDTAEFVVENINVVQEDTNAPFLRVSMMDVTNEVAHNVALSLNRIGADIGGFTDPVPWGFTGNTALTVVCKTTNNCHNMSDPDNPQLGCQARILPQGAYCTSCVRPGPVCEQTVSTGGGGLISAFCAACALLL